MKRLALPKRVGRRIIFPWQFGSVKGIVQQRMYDYKVGIQPGNVPRKARIGIVSGRDIIRRYDQVDYDLRHGWGRKTRLGRFLEELRHDYVDGRIPKSDYGMFYNLVEMVEAKWKREKIDKQSKGKKFHGKKANYTKKEAEALRAGIDPEAIALTRRFKRRLEEDPRLDIAFREYIRAGEKMDVLDGWNQGRDYSNYNSALEPFLGHSILAELESIAERKGGKINVLDDGAGSGFFLSRLKSELERIKIEAKTSAVVLAAPEALLDAKNAGQIDHIYETPAEGLLPKEPQDAIFSVMGSAEYSMEVVKGTRAKAPESKEEKRNSIPLFKRELILKYAHCLNPGGTACIAIDIANLDVRGRDIRRDVERVLRRRGFKANFHRIPEEKKKELNVPRDILIIRKPLEWSKK